MHTVRLCYIVCTHFTYHVYYTHRLCSSVAEQGIHKPKVAGSNPARAKLALYHISAALRLRCKLARDVYHINTCECTAVLPLRGTAAVLPSPGYSCITLSRVKAIYKCVTHYMMSDEIVEISAVEIGQHLYWNIGNYHIHAQVLINTWIVMAIVLGVAYTTTRRLQTVPASAQNFIEYFVEFIRDIAKTQVGKEYKDWVPFIGTLFAFIFVSNWSGALIPWKIIELPSGELSAPTNDVNTTTALALMVSFAYFYAGMQKKGLSYFKRYLEPTPILLPINILEDFTKPLSLSFRLFGNILADELVVAVLLSLVPLVVPIPLILLGLFTSAIQALIFATLAGAYVGEAID